MKLIFYDFEVFKKLWLVVFIDYDTRERRYIIDNPAELENFYNENVDTIFCGYNSRQYDQFIFKGIMLGLDPFHLSNKIIGEDVKGYQLLGRKAKDYPINNFDVSTGFHGLKQLEGFMGSKIKESSVSFDIERKLTEAEITEVLEYCTHDVEETIKVFENRREEFDSQLALIEAFNLPFEMFNKTKAQLSAHILDANRGKSFYDEFKLQFPDTLNISEKYQYIVDWYKNPQNMNYSKVLHTNVAGVPHVYAWGGIHGAIPNYADDGIILCCDVASLYPSIMIEYGYLSRNVSNPEKYKEIRDTRLKLKAEKNKMQLPYKIVLNATYGAMKDQYNGLYDPLMANNVCVAGQLLLLDLTEKIEPYCQLIQSNTDGLFLKVEDMETVNKIKEIAREWELRTRLDLEWDIFSRIFQKDVNNYIIINENGEYKSKGAYVKKLNAIDYDLPIINKALLNYFVKDQSIEDTINNCDDLIEYQKIVKVSRLYKYALHGKTRIPEKVLRVFASTDITAEGVFKVKNEGSKEKISNTPPNCFINNDNIIGVKIPQVLDKQYYIDMANKRLGDYLSVKSNKKPKIPSGIKGISVDIRDKILELAETEFSRFVDLLALLIDNGCSKKAIEVLTKLNYFKKYGGNLKLVKIFEEFTTGKNKYEKKLKDAVKWDRLNALLDFEESLPDESISIYKQLMYELEILGNMKSTFEYPKGTALIISVDKSFSPRARVYGLSTGNIMEIKVQKKLFNKSPFGYFDIVQLTNLKSKAKLKCTGQDDLGKPIFKEMDGEKEIWAEDYFIKKRYTIE